MTRIATFLRPVPVAATALAAATGAWLAWTPIAGADTRRAPAHVADLVDRTSPAVVTVLATQEADERPAWPACPRARPSAPARPSRSSSAASACPRAACRCRRPQPPEDGPQGVALGSGFVIEDDGYIVTNNHVVDDADDGEGAPRPTSASSTPRSSAPTRRPTSRCIKIDADDLPELPLGDSDAVRVGEDVIAVGNPFGLGGTVTRGIVSAMARDINAGPYVDFIQTDAAINRGNSGGPLLNLEGEVIGVNSAIYSPNGGSVGVGFAIPSNTVKTVVAQLRDDGSVERGWLGVHDPERDAGDRHRHRPRRPARRARRRRRRRRPVGRQARDRRRDPRLRRQAGRIEPRAAEARRRHRARRRGQGRGAAQGRGRDRRLHARPVRRRPGSPRPRPATQRGRHRLRASSAPRSRRSPRPRASSSGSTTTSTASSSPRSRATAVAADAGLEVGDVILQVGDTAVQTPADVDQALHGGQDRRGACCRSSATARGSSSASGSPDARSGPEHRPGRARTRAPASTLHEETAMSRRILVVEDDADTRDYLAKGLRETGYTVEATASGREGLMHAHRRRLRRPGARPHAARPRRPLAPEVGPRRRRPDPGDPPDRDERHRRARARPARRRRRLRGQALLLRRALRPARGGAAPPGRDPRRADPPRLRRPRARPHRPHRPPRRPPHRAPAARVPDARVPDAPPGPRRHPHHAARRRLGLPLRPAHQRHRRPHQPPAPQDRRRGRAAADPHRPRHAATSSPPTA